MDDKVEKKRLAILKILQDQKTPISSKLIQELLKNKGHIVSERTVRFHLCNMDAEGLTICFRNKGRKITEKGLVELGNARAHDKVGFLITRIDQLTHNMDFNLSKLKGTVVINVSLVKKQDMEKACALMTAVYKAGYAMGRLIALFKEGERVGDLTIPEGFVGIGTVCSVTLNGILLDSRIPVYSKFGGLLEIRGGEPTRFVAIINYDGTTIDPLEIFINSRMTDYTGATLDGNGKIGASFREVPEGTEDEVVAIVKKLEKTGLAGFLKIGYPGQPLLGIPIGEGRVGIVLIGGLNPLAILVEQGIEVESKAMSGLIEYEQLFFYDELTSRLNQYVS